MPSERACERVRSWKADSDHLYQDLDQRNSTSRRVNYKTGAKKDKKCFRLGDAAKYMLDDNEKYDDIIVMTAPRRETRHHRKGYDVAHRSRGGHPSAPASRSSAPKRFIPGALPWYRILIPYGIHYDQDVILKALLNRLTPEVFVPRLYKFQGKAAVFYVDDVKIAEKLFYSDRKITMSDGFKLAIKARNVYPNEIKDINMNLEAERYNADDHVSVDAALSLPPPPLQPKFLADAAGEDALRNFLMQYFHIYDSESREPLLGAYHENAAMSIDADRDSEQMHFKTGNRQIVSFLSELPRTAHDSAGFAVDLSVFTASVIMLTVTGVFKESDKLCGGNITCTFHRTFVIVPKCDGGLSIVNDTLLVTAVARDHDEDKTSLAVPTSAATDEQRAVLLDMLRQETGMNEEFSNNCLRENGWDPQRTLSVFIRLNTEGKIPPEAFVA